MQYCLTPVCCVIYCKTKAGLCATAPAAGVTAPHLSRWLAPAGPCCQSLPFKVVAPTYHEHQRLPVTHMTGNKARAHWKNLVSSMPGSAWYTQMTMPTPLTVGVTLMKNTRNSSSQAPVMFLPKTHPPTHRIHTIAPTPAPSAGPPFTPERSLGPVHRRCPVSVSQPPPAGPPPPPCRTTHSIYLTCQHTRKHPPPHTHTPERPLGPVHPRASRGQLGVHHCKTLKLRSTLQQHSNRTAHIQTSVDV